MKHRSHLGAQGCRARSRLAKLLHDKRKGRPKEIMSRFWHCVVAAFGFGQWLVEVRDSRLNGAILPPDYVSDGFLPRPKAALRDRRSSGLHLAFSRGIGYRCACAV